jgi:hypothetical protein
MQPNNICPMKLASPSYSEEATECELTRCMWYVTVENAFGEESHCAIGLLSIELGILKEAIQKIGYNLQEKNKQP